MRMPGSSFVLPIIIVCETTHRSLDSTENDRNVRKEMFQNLCIDDAWIIRTHSRTAIRRVSVVTAQTFVGCIAVDHPDPSQRHWLQRKVWDDPALWSLGNLHANQVVVQWPRSPSASKVRLITAARTTDDPHTHRPLNRITSTQSQPRISISFLVVGSQLSNLYDFIIVCC